jgi:hypothetical protein
MTVMAAASSRRREQPLGFAVEAISVATDESESSVTVDRF